MTATDDPVGIEVADPDGPDAAWCRDRYFAEIDALFDTGYDPAEALVVRSDDLRPPRGSFVIARWRGRPVGSGGVTLPPGEPAFLKRMWVDTEVRGRGIGGLILEHLEAIALASGADTVRLDTNSLLVAAARLYESRGYVRVADFNGEPHADRWYAKRLTAGPGDASW